MDGYTSRRRKSKRKQTKNTLVTTPQLMIITHSIPTAAMVVVAWRDDV